MVSWEPLGRARGGSRGESRKMFIWKSDKEVIKLLLDVYQAGVRQVKPVWPVLCSINAELQTRGLL